MWSSGSEQARQLVSYSFQCLLLLWKIGCQTSKELIQSLVHSQVSLHHDCWLSWSKKESVYQCAMLIITIECWSKNSMKRGVRLSKKPLKLSTSRSRDLRIFLNYKWRINLICSHRYKVQKFLSCNLWLWKEIPLGWNWSSVLNKKCHTGFYLDITIIQISIMPSKESLLE